MSDTSSSLTTHLLALRESVLRMVIFTFLLYPVCYYIAPYWIEFLTQWACPPEMGRLYYFAPMEVFWVQLQLALVLALIFAYPWNLYQLWRFFAPALYPSERSAFVMWITFSSLLFLGGAVFCIGLILPLLMNFSISFATRHLQPMLGLSAFLSLVSWLALAFGVMFQSPILVMVMVRFGIVSCDTLVAKRPYVIVLILILAGILTPPDLVSQVLLGLPTWLLFELGIFLARRVSPQQNNQNDFEKKGL